MTGRFFDEDDVAPSDPGRDSIESVAHVRYEHPLPSDAARLGLDRNTEEGAMIGMAGSLNARRAGHRVIAWVLLAAVALPVLFTVVVEIF